MLAGLTITILLSLDAFLVVWILRKGGPGINVGDPAPATQGGRKRLSLG
jgi:hypothetical protein